MLSNGIVRGSARPESAPQEGMERDKANKRLASMRNPEIQLKPKLEDPSQIHWVHLLPDLKAVDILKVGAAGRENVASLSRRSGKRISCVGPTDPNLRDHCEAFYDSLDQAPANSFDVVIIDEKERIPAFHPSLRGATSFRSLLRVLRDGGRALICLPEGLAHLRSRYRVTRQAAAAGFERIQYYLSSASSESPRTIVPCSDGPLSALKYLSQPHGRTVPGPGISLKPRLKQFLYRFLSIYNPRLGLIILADKAAIGKREQLGSLCERAQTQIKRDATSDARLITVVCSWRYEGRTQLFIHDTEPHQLIAVGSFAEEGY